jgi:hypothetical protein
MKDRDDEMFNNIRKLFRLFYNRPNHLAKYLIENNAFNDDFIHKVKYSHRLIDIDIVDDMNFKSILEMESFFISLLKDTDSEHIEQSLNSKLVDLVKSDKFEDAARLRDYMIKNNFKIF